MRGIIRRIEVTHTLGGVVSLVWMGRVRKEGETYKSPRAKTNLSPHFWRLGSCRPFMTPIGNNKVKKSVDMLATAFAYQKMVRLIQVPGTVLSQTRIIGMHWKTVAAMLATA